MAEKENGLKHLLAAEKGRQNRAMGGLWEDVIEGSCMRYGELGLAEIEKTPEPMRPLKRAGNGRFVAIYSKKAQPDYKGTLKGGKAVVFEAKYTETDRIRRSAVSEEQELKLDAHAKLGAECFVLLSFGFEQFFRIPWDVFKKMKENFGRRYVKAEELGEYRIKYVGGILHFLPEMETGEQC